MERLDEAIIRSETQRGDIEQLERAKTLQQRLQKELSVGRALANIPEVKLPPEGQLPANYWAVSAILCSIQQLGSIEGIAR